MNNRHPGGSRGPVDVLDSGFRRNDEFLRDELVDLERRRLKRSLRTVEQIDAARLTIAGRSLVNFSSNNYLGLSRHPHVLEAVKQVLDHWGAGATSSRLISGTSIIHQDLESALAAFLSQEGSLLFPSGYMANLGVMTSLVGPGDAVIMDRLCHASLVDAVRLSGARLLVYRHTDLAEAERALKRAQSFRRRILATESLFSMDGDFAPLAELAQLAERYGAIRLVDEAHAIGVWGDRGQGLSTGWDIVVGTLSKSLGSQGGFVTASREIIDTLVNKARPFIFTTGLSPMCVAAAQASLSLIQGDQGPRQHLRATSMRLREGLRALGYKMLHSESQIVPIVIGAAMDALLVAQHLQDSGIFAPAIRPPTVHAGECRIRFSVTADHTDQDIDQLLRVIQNTSGDNENNG